MNKPELRKMMLEKRTKLSADEIKTASAAVTKNLFADIGFLRAVDVGFYYPLTGEIDTSEAMERAMLFGKRIYLPKIANDEMVFCAFKAGDELVKNKRGFLEPAETDVGEPEIVIVPGVAFDLEKHRLGFGKGHFDKYLRGRDAVAIGICHEWQVVDKLPSEKHDVQMNKVIAGDWVLE